MIMMKKNYSPNTTISKALNSKEESLQRYNDLRTPLFQYILPSPPLPLRRLDKEKEYNDTFLRPPQCPTVEAQKQILINL